MTLSEKLRALLAEVDRLRNESNAAWKFTLQQDAKIKNYLDEIERLRNELQSTEKARSFAQEMLRVASRWIEQSTP